MVLLYARSYAPSSCQPHSRTLPSYHPTPSYRTAQAVTMLWLEILFVIGLIGTTLRTFRPSRLPCGPRGLPLLGNIFQVPSKLLFLKLDEWAKDYGSIFTLNMAGRPLIVLNDAKGAAAILDRMSSVTSDCPRFIMAGETMTKGLLIAFMQYGVRWRRLRRLTHGIFNIRAAESLYAI